MPKPEEINQSFEQGLQMQEANQKRTQNTIICGGQRRLTFRKKGRKVIIRKDSENQQENREHDMLPVL